METASEIMLCACQNLVIMFRIKYIEGALVPPPQKIENLPAYVVKLTGWFGAGELPGPTGTWGSLAALPFAYVFYHLFGVSFLFYASVICYFVGVYVCHIYVRETGDKDPKFAVIDEVAGQWFTIVFCSGSVTSFILAFFLFRAFDIIKIQPARAAEKLPGGWGVMTDDMIAGLYAGACVFFIQLIFNIA